MSLQCKTCGEDVTDLNFEQATIMEGVDGTWCVDLILTCPQCGQTYNAFVPTSELQPLPHDDYSEGICL
ncbi:hypothetical protein SMQC13_00560 [Serratia marcescens]|nr:hypothetical protein SMQC13_00560 [Serratia marcescens]